MSLTLNSLGSFIHFQNRSIYLLQGFSEHVIITDHGPVDAKIIGPRSMTSSVCGPNPNNEHVWRFPPTCKIRQKAIEWEKGI